LKSSYVIAERRFPARIGILPEFREYERMSTVTVNAYLQPLMQGYLRSLASTLSKTAKHPKLFVMQSSGGITTLETAAS